MPQVTTTPWFLLCELRSFASAASNPLLTPRLVSVSQHQGSLRIGLKLRSLLLCIAVLGLGSVAVPAFAAGTTYYVNNQAGSNCSDAGPHSFARPWCTFAPLNRIKSFKPGDMILLARGASWNEQLNLAGHGTSADPISLDSYGVGPVPKILRNQATRDICVLLTDGSFWNISNLEVGRASVGILLHYTQLSNQGIDIRNVYAHDNKGIWAGYSTDHPKYEKVKDPFAERFNINVSSGILFNLASDLTFSSSQYVLKDVTLSQIHGSSNVDSVAFDAETNTIENQDGHNAFQNVVLNGLFLSNDNGHVAAQYQNAGLGCSDSLRLLGMSKVTLMNSILYEEAGCHTPSGTAAVILGRVSEVNFANNIFFGVPHSDSPDETAIDFEWSEDQVSLHANLFAGNAGAAVEILNIHPRDHTNAIDFRGNTFMQNASSHKPGSASIWEDNKGFSAPSGKILNNLYFEQYGGFLAGKKILALANSNELPMTDVSNYAAELFSDTQGKNQWRYMYEAPDSTWKNLPHYASSTDNGAWMAPGGEYVSAFNLKPGACTHPCSAGAVARVWVAPHAGIVSIRGRVLKSDAHGHGVITSISRVSGTTVYPLWPASSGPQLIAGDDHTGYATDLDEIHVEEGDMIRFEVHATGDSSHDVVSWTPSVGYVNHKPRLTLASFLTGAAFSTAR